MQQQPYPGYYQPPPPQYQQPAPYPQYQAPPSKKSSTLKIVVIIVVVIIIVGAVIGGVMCAMLGGENKDIQITFGSMYYTDRLANPTRFSDAGKKFFVAPVTVKNTGDSSHYFGVTFFKVTTKNGDTVQPQSWLIPHENALTSTDLSAGTSTTGNLVYILNILDQPVTMIYDEPAYSEKKFPLGGFTILTKNNQPPVAKAGPDVTAYIDQSISFDGSKSTDPESVETLDYSWDWGETGYTGYGDKTTHSYDKIGEYTVTLTVKDDGDLISTDTLKVTIKSPFELTIEDHGWESGGYHDGDFYVDIKIKNVSPETMNIYHTFMKVETTSGSSYSWSGDNETKGSVPSSLNSGSTATWSSYFEVPTSATPKFLWYEDHTKATF